MDYNINKEVTVDLSLRKLELWEITVMLNEWKRDIGDKLPNGPTLDQNLMISELNRIFQEASR
jgi:hypothetical protein